MSTRRVAATAFNAALWLTSAAFAQAVPPSPASPPSDVAKTSAAQSAAVPPSRVGVKLPITPSRQPDDDADWRLFEAPRLGLRMLVTEARSPDKRVVFSTNRHAVLSKEASVTDAEFLPLITFYTKRADQSVRDAIRDRFIRRLPPQARHDCRVVRTNKNSVDLGPGRQTFIIDSFGRYGAKIQRKYAGGPGDSSCGRYGWQQANSYFEYHPEQDRTRYMYVYLGWDPAPFDDRSIELRPMPSSAARDGRPDLTTTR